MTENHDYLAECISIDLVDLNDEFVRVPADISYWNGQLADATRIAMTAKLDLDRAKAQLFTTIRASKVDNKQPSIDTVNAQVDADQDIYDLELDYILKEAERLRARGAVDAVSAKRDMIQSLGAKLRAEMRSDPTTVSHTF